MGKRKSCGERSTKRGTPYKPLAVSHGTVGPGAVGISTWSEFVERLPGGGKVVNLKTGLQIKIR